MSSHLNLSDYPQATLLPPAADAAGRTGAKWGSLKYAHKAFLVFLLNQGNAATILLTPLQATSAAGAGSKALTNNVPIFTSLDEVNGAALSRATDAANYTTDAATKTKRVIFEIDPRTALDIAGGFCYLGCSTGASNAANITAAELIVIPARQTGVNLPSLLT